MTKLKNNSRFLKHCDIQWLFIARDTNDDYRIGSYCTLPMYSVTASNLKMRVLWMACSPEFRQFQQACEPYRIKHKAEKLYNFSLTEIASLVSDFDMIPFDRVVFEAQAAFVAAHIEGLQTTLYTQIQERLYANR